MSQALSWGNLEFDFEQSLGQLGRWVGGVDVARDPVLILCILKTYRNGTGRYLPGGVDALLADQA